MRSIQNLEEDLERIATRVREKMPSLPYHNYGHVEDVYNVAMTLAELESVELKERFAGIEPRDGFLLGAAALIHDVFYHPGAADNEEKSAHQGWAWLVTLGYSKPEAERVARLVIATKLPTKPQNLLEAILCDADLDNLGREDFMEQNRAWREELGVPESAQWYLDSIKFLEDHQYYTPSAKRLRDEGKRRNIERLYAKVKEYEDR